jgi:hypothetical protein
MAMTKFTPEEARVAEEQAWLDAGIGQPPSRDPAASIAKILMLIGGLILAAFVIASLASCATPATRTQTVEVKVPIATHAVNPADVPALPAPLPKRPADARQALDLALAQVCRFVGYALKADPLLRVSAGLPPQEAPRYPECER